MANVDRIAELRGISSIKAIDYWNQVCVAAGMKLSTYEVLTELLDQGTYAASITANQLVEKKKAIEAEKKKREEELQATEADRLKKLADQRVAQQRAEEKEFRQLLEEISATGFTHSHQVSTYITSNSLGYKYKHISGKLEMEMEGNVWDFDGGFPPKIYARLCQKLGLKNQRTRAVAGKFTPYKDILKH